jgi:hypothetical protein
VDPHLNDADPDADSDSTYHPDADPDADADSDFLFDVDPDADPDPQHCSIHHQKPVDDVYCRALY